jgi:MFS family permease
MLQVSIAVSGISMALLAAFNDTAALFNYLIVFALVYGAFGGAFMGLLPVVTADVIGIARFPKAMGIMYSAQAPCVLIGGPIAGWMFQSSGSYVTAWIVFGCILAASACFLFRLPTTHSPPALRRCCQQPSATVVPL